MSILKNLALTALLAVAAIGCKNDSPAPQNVVVVTPPVPVEPKPETIDPNKCYEGEIVWVTSCTKGIWVKVLNGNIGDPSEDPYKETYNQQKWTNTIWIANGQMLGADVAIDRNLFGKKVFFKLNPTSKFVDCQEFRPIICVTTAESTKTPDKCICATSLSFTKCN
jgi:hypothetical protein